MTSLPCRARAFALALTLGFFLTSTADAQPEQPSARQPAPNAAPGTELQTPDRNNTASVANAVVAPLHDLNITRQSIPPVLLTAITNPYDPPRPRNCAVIEREVAVLDSVLGPDLDRPETPQSPSLTLHNGRIELSILNGAAESLLPFAGFVRTLSGAGHHDELVVEAITAGSVRRGYLKGMGEVMRCPPPGRPTHFANAPPPAREDGRVPLYPIN